MATGFDRRQPTRQSFAFQTAAPYQDRPDASGQSRGASIVGGESRSGVVPAGPITDAGPIAEGLGAFVERAFAPHLARRQTEEFFKGYSKALSGAAMDEIDKGNSPIKSIFGPSFYEQGAAMYTASAKVSEHIREMMDDRDTLKQMPPEELAKVLNERMNSLMTGSASADMLIQQQVIEASKPVLETIAKDRAAWQQVTAKHAKFTSDEGAAGNLQAIRSAQADLNDPDENDNSAMSAAITSFRNSVLVKPEGMTDASFHDSLYQLMRSSAQKGNLAAVGVMKAAGVMNLFDEDKQVRLEDSIKRYTEKSYEDFAATDEKFIAMANEAHVQELQVKTGASGAWSPQQFAEHRRRMNAYVRAKTGGDEDFYSFAKIDSETASAAGDVATAYNRAQSRNWELEDRKFTRDTALMVEEQKEQLADRRAGAAWATGNIIAYQAAGGDMGRIDARAYAEYQQGNFSGLVRMFDVTGKVSDYVKQQVEADVNSSLDEQYGTRFEAAHAKWKAMYAKRPGLAITAYGENHYKMMRYESLVGEAKPQAAYLRAFGNTAVYGREAPALSKDADAALGVAITKTQPTWIGRMFGAPSLGSAEVQVIKNIVARRVAKATSNSNMPVEAVAPGELSAARSSGELQIAGGKPWGAAVGTPSFAQRVGALPDEADKAFLILTDKRLQDAGMKAGVNATLDIAEIETPKGDGALHIVARDTEGKIRQVIIGLPDYRATVRNLAQMQVDAAKPSAPRPTIAESAATYRRQQAGKGIPVSQAGNTGKALRQAGQAAVRWNNDNIEKARVRYRPNDKR